MMRYSIEPRDQIFVKSHKNNQNLSGKCSQIRLDHTKKTPTDGLKSTLKRIIKKTA